MTEPWRFTNEGLCNGGGEMRRLCIICRCGLKAVAVVFGVGLLMSAVGMGYVTYELNGYRMARARAAEGNRTVAFSEDGVPVFGGDLGPTAMWITVGGKQIMIEPKWSHILAHVAISALELMVGGTLIWLTFKRKRTCVGRRGDLSVP